VCSTTTQSVAELGRAIDELAAQAGGPATADHVVVRLAELWSRIAALDPEVARRLPTYRLD
jgi:hypothetical protein